MALYILLSDKHPRGRWCLPHNLMSGICGSRSKGIGKNELRINRLDSCFTIQKINVICFVLPFFDSFVLRFVAYRE